MNRTIRRFRTTFEVVVEHDERFDAAELAEFLGWHTVGVRQGGESHKCFAADIKINVDWKGLREIHE